MTGQPTIDELLDLGSGHPAPDDIVRLYREAFADFGTRALWRWRAIEQPTVTQVLAIANARRIEGDLRARALAERVEQACRAAVTHLPSSHAVKLRHEPRSMDR